MTRRTQGSRPGTPDPAVLQQVVGTRELFWQNVAREFLTGLSVMWASRRDGKVPEGHTDMFDGRMGVITQQGHRIPIAAVYPLFACGVVGVGGDDAQRALSTEVECTVFQIETPEGQSFTLPLHEIRAFHSLSAELMEELKAAASEGDGDEGDEEGVMPFGFAAFTSLARSRGLTSPPIAPPFIGPDFPPPH